MSKADPRYRLSEDAAMSAALRWARQPGDSVCDAAWHAVQAMRARGIITDAVALRCERRIARMAED